MFYCTIILNMHLSPNTMNNAMKNLLLALCTLSLLSACQTSSQAPIPAHQDAHGCLSTTGKTWSSLKQQCIHTVNQADFYLKEIINGTTYRIDVILSEDRQHAEIFSENLPKNTILTAVKGGFISDDNRLRLIKYADGWKLRRNP